MGMFDINKRPTPSLSGGFLSGLGEDLDYSQYANLDTGTGSGINWGNATNSGMTFGQGNMFQTQGMPGIGMPAAQKPGFLGGGWMDRVDPKTGMTTQGKLGIGLSALQAGAGMYLGSKQLGLAEDQFAEAKRQFGKNFGAQVQNYNTAIRDRQLRRYTGAGGANTANNPWQSPEAYMEKNRLVD